MKQWLLSRLGSFSCMRLSACDPLDPGMFSYPLRTNPHGPARAMLVRCRASEGRGMRPDRELQQDVQSELRWTPELDDSHIVVRVAQGVVTLAGYVGSFRERTAAELATTRLRGVAGITNDIEVRLAAQDLLPDALIAREACAAIAQAIAAPTGQITAQVHQGRITLEGHV